MAEQYAVSLDIPHLPKVDFSVGVVLPAAGCGERMKMPIPKQFCEVHGRPLICYTIECFNRQPWVKQMVISTSKEHVDHLRDIVDKVGFSKVMVVEGGTTRHRSIHAAVKVLQQVCADLDVVVIHDAVRPFVSSNILTRIVWAARSHGAAGVCRPLVSTVIARDEQQQMTESLDRRRYVASEMPQAFQTSVISAAYDQCTVDDYDHGTECLLLAMKYVGVQATILDGDPDLWKVTYKKDLFAAEGLIKERMMRVKLIGLESHQALCDAITAQLEHHQLQLIDAAGLNHTLSQPSGSGDTTSSGVGAVNTFVILHTDLNSINTVGRLKDLQTGLLPVARKPQLFDFTFLHIFLAPAEAEIMEWQMVLSSIVTRIAREEENKNVLIFGVLGWVNQTTDKVSKMVVSTLLRGHMDFAGQIFLVL